MHPFFCFQRVIGLGWAGLGWAGDYQNILGKVGGSEMEFGGVNVHALDSGENTVCFFGISNAFYEHLHVKISNIIPENVPCIQHSHCVKCLDIARRKHYQAKYMHPFFCFQRVIGLGSAGLVITKIFWEKLVAVKWSLVGSMYM